jgi:hypothetical protein
LLEAAAITFAIATMVAVSAIPARAAGESGLTADTACAQVRASVRQLAKAERNQALALHLMADGKPTPLVASRLGELQQQMGNLRQVLREVRDRAPVGDQYVSECVDLGFRSLSEAENLSAEIQSIVMAEGGPLGPPPQLRSYRPRDAAKLPEPPLPDAPPIREE